MSSIAGPLANGVLPTVQGVLFRCPDNVSWVVVDFQSYVNKTMADVTMNIYKRKRNQTARQISPLDLELNAQFRMDFADEIQRLAPGDTIEGICSAADSVDFIIDGITTNNN